MPRTPKIKRTMWGIVTPRGEFVTTSMRETRSDAINFYISDVWDTWADLYNRGYRAVKLRAEEV